MGCAGWARWCGMREISGEAGEVGWPPTGEESSVEENGGSGGDSEVEGEAE